MRRTQFCMCISHLKFIVLFAYGERREGRWGGGTRPLRGVAWPKPIRISAFVQSIQKYRNTGGVINQKWSTARKEKQQQRRWEGRKGGKVCCEDFGRHREGWQISIQPRGGPQKLKQMLLSSLERAGNVCNITMINVQRVAFRIAFILKFMQATRFLYLCSMWLFKNSTGNIVLFIKYYLFYMNLLLS